MNDVEPPHDEDRSTIWPVPFMDLTGYLALGRGIGLQRAMEVLSNNVANVDSIGFRRQDLAFEEDVHRAGDPGNVAFGIDRGTVVDQREGSLRETGSMLDMALVGQGWFHVQAQDGDRLTRAGRFSANAQGQLVTADNSLVLDAAGSPLSIPVDATTISVAGDGTVSADEAVVGRIGVVSLLQAQSCSHKDPDCSARMVH